MTWIIELVQYTITDGKCYLICEDGSYVHETDVYCHNAAAWQWTGNWREAFRYFDPHQMVHGKDRDGGLLAIDAAISHMMTDGYRELTVNDAIIQECRAEEFTQWRVAKDNEISSLMESGCSQDTV